MLCCVDGDCHFDFHSTLTRTNDLQRSLFFTDIKWSHYTITAFDYKNMIFEALNLLSPLSIRAVRAAQTFSAAHLQDSRLSW